MKSNFSNNICMKFFVAVVNNQTDFVNNKSNGAGWITFSKSIEILGKQG